MIEGEANIEGNITGKRDAVGIWETDSIKIEVSSSAEILVIEVPMN